MNRDTAKSEIINREPNFLTPTEGKKINEHISYICPKCKNGSGDSKTGLACYLKSGTHRHYKCFGCGLHEDVIGLWKIHKGITDDKEAFSTLYDYYGIQVDEIMPSINNNPKVKNVPTSVSTEKLNNKMAYYQECQKHITETDYLQRRGISQELAKKYRLGYDPHFTECTGGQVWKALIIPTGSASYVARNTAPQADKSNRYRKHGASMIFNAKESLKQTEKPIFVVEGELDALSILEVGGQAIGLGSTANSRKFIELIKTQKPQKPLILALDNDESGIKAAETIARGLTALDVPYIMASLSREAKDANELLQKDRNVLQEAVSKATEEALSQQVEELETQKAAYLATSTANYLQNFIDGISDSANTPCIPTGFEKLDSVLDGGLYEGLYILGAISSLGKTTLALQIVDQIAEAGNDILIFSLEMARMELMSKSISRLTLLDTIENNGNIQNAKTAREITTGLRYLNYNDAEHDLIQQAITDYGEFAENIFIHEGIGDIGTAQIRETIEKHITFTGKKPIVLIDYVQILAPADVRATDKQNIDKSVLELKRLSRDFKIPVIGISSFNRASYKDAVSMEAFKESGSLEYGSDVLMGLQLKGAGKTGFDVNEAKKKDPREVELVILKNRNGATGKTIAFEYYPRFNYFKET